VAIANEQKEILIVEKLDNGSRSIRLRDQSTNYNWDNYLADDNGDRLQLLMRSSTYDRINGITTYVRIRDSKFWIEEDWTEEGIANELINAGVPKEDIVLAFHNPKMRSHTEFAVAYSLPSVK
jgi:hypothetical protein